MDRVTETSGLRFCKRARLLSWAIGLTLLIPVAFFVDVPLAKLCRDGRVPGDLRRLLTWSELFAHGLGVLVIATTIWVLDPKRRAALPRVLAAVFGAGLAADIVKLFVARWRPAHFFEIGDVTNSFAGWLPILFPVDGVGSFDHRVQSFPSAHTAVAVGLAIGLTWLYPRGRLLFAIFAVLAAGQRLEAGAHFLSDTLAGAAIGCLVANIVMHGRLGTWFDHLERRWRASAGRSFTS